jgi:2-dehydropantoate 2-reductase
MPAHKPSMLKDLEQGREPEFDAIYGAVGDFARAAGVPTPLLDAFLPLLRQRAAIAVGRP